MADYINDARSLIFFYGSSVKASRATGIPAGSLRRAARDKTTLTKQGVEKGPDRARFAATVKEGIASLSRSDKGKLKAAKVALDRVSELSIREMLSVRAKKPTAANTQDKSYTMENRRYALEQLLKQKKPLDQTGSQKGLWKLFLSGSP